MGERKLPTPYQILQIAGKANQRGEFTKASQAMQGIVDYPLDRFPKWNTFKQQQLMQGARAYVTAEIGLAGEQPHGIGVATHLDKAKKVITTIYENPSIKNAADEVKTDMARHPYDFATAMTQDKIAYTLLLAGLTGNPSLLTQAITMMDKVISSAEDSTTQALVTFERDLLLHDRFLNQGSLEEVTESFYPAFNALLERGDKDLALRLATRYAVAVEKVFKGGKVAAYQEIIGENFYDEAAFFEEIEREIATQNKYREWQRTNQPHTHYVQTLALQ
jgi:hypothetical protein